MSTSPQTWLGRAALVVVIATSVLAWDVWSFHHSAVVHEIAAVRTRREPSEERAASPLGRNEATRAQILRQAEALRTAVGPEDRRKVFVELRRLLSGISPAAESEVIRDLLESRTDVPSRLDFSVGPDGFLKQPSSLRVFLLDQLAQVDRAAAATYATRVLGSLDSSDEWAVSLRNYALGNTNEEARVFLQQKWREMTSWEPWQQNPSVGFLEAFDVAVYTGGIELLPDLTELLQQKENRAVAHAAYLALDRLAIQEPVAVLHELQNDPDLMNGREETRANLFSRADVEDPQQMALLEEYLLDPRRSAAELRTFAALFPNANYAISYNLLTRTFTPDGSTLARRDREALRVFEGWLREPRFETLKPYVQQITDRLTTFVVQSKGGR